ncbi:MAG: OB-fold domain-containing protein [Chloroflexota bacterium]
MTAPKGKIPELPDLFDWTKDGVRLQSAKCNSCGTYFFPASHLQHRPGCSRQGVENVFLSRRGKLATYTVQYYMCPPPFKTAGDITPYGIGMVEFPEGISVTGIITETDLNALKIGLDMETTTYTLYKDAEGNDVVTWAFRVVK